MGAPRTGAPHSRFLTKAQELIIPTFSGLRERRKFAMSIPTWLPAGKVFFAEQSLSILIAIRLEEQELVTRKAADGRARPSPYVICAPRVSTKQA
jgi:hypothetical protein